MFQRQSLAMFEPIVAEAFYGSPGMVVYFLSVATAFFGLFLTAWRL